MSPRDWEDKVWIALLTVTAEKGRGVARDILTSFGAVKLSEVAPAKLPAVFRLCERELGKPVRLPAALQEGPR